MAQAISHVDEPRVRICEHIVCDGVSRGARVEFPLRKKQIVQQIVTEGGVTVEENAIVQKSLDKGLEERKVHQILGELKGRGEISKNTQGSWYSNSS